MPIEGESHIVPVLFFVFVVTSACFKLSSFSCQMSEHMVRMTEVVGSSVNTLLVIWALPRCVG